MISVIIPVYNTAQYLEQCIASVLNQTYGNLEIIAIDDGSTDNSPQILEQLASQDTRIKVIHQSNCGVSSARNRGLREACGDYITFVDSDDTVETDLYETLLDLMHQYQVKITHCSYNRIRDGVVKPVGNTGNIFVQSRVEALWELTCGSMVMGGCCNKLYARELFDGIRFDTGLKLSEDELVNFQVFSRVDTIVYQDVCKYNYLDSTTSACRNTHSVRKALDHVEVAERIFLLNRHQELEPALRRKKLSAYLELYKALLREPRRDRTQLRKAADQISRLRREGAAFSRKQKLMYGLMRTCPPAFRLLYGAYDRIRVID